MLSSPIAPGAGLEAARRLGPAGVLDEVTASGLRGRGGAGFPTGQKWRAVAANVSELPTTVVVNAAEGEPGSFKDRAVLRANALGVVEGALIAAKALAADGVIVALKRAFETERARVDEAIAEARSQGWTDGVEIAAFAGPDEYLYGEETGLLEVLDGRQPFPRVAPPYRYGVDEIGEARGSVGDVDLAGPDDATVAPPTLVNNAETMANIPAILANGADWFRQHGTDASPGTLACTVSGRTQRHGVAEFPMGTPLREVIERVGGGAEPGHEIVAVMSGVANPLLRSEQLDVPVSYEGMEDAGTSLGAAGFIVFDDRTDFAAVAHGVARFLAVESCGQCTPCKQDGLALADLWAKLCGGTAEEHDLQTIRRRSATVGDRARCYLALQHQAVASSVLERFPDDVQGHLDGSAPPVQPELVAELVDISNGKATLDERFREKQPDWTYDAEFSGQSPADRFAEHRNGDD